MKKLLVLGVITACLLGPQANAQNITLRYAHSCAEWANARSGGYDFSRGLAEGWLVGLLDGFAVTVRRDIWSTGAGLEPDQVFYWMDRYCEKNPLGITPSGAVELMTERLGDGWNAR